MTKSEINGFADFRLSKECENTHEAGASLREKFESV